MSTLYTIGYATKPITTFQSQLHRYAINMVADVRSVPYSKAFPDYHHDVIKKHLKAACIGYVYLGAQLGPRSKDPAHYDATGQVQFMRLMQSDLFLHGIQRLVNGIEKQFNIALMCAEKDPATCHRSLLIGYALIRRGIQVQHITHDGKLETEQALEKRLQEETRTLPDMFTPPDACLELAYQKQCKRIAYRDPNLGNYKLQQ